MAYRMVVSLLIAIVSLLVVTDAQFGIPVGPLEEVSPSEFERMRGGITPVQQQRALGRGILMGRRQFNTVPSRFAQQRLMLRPGQMQFRLNTGIPPVFPTQFNTNALARRATAQNQAGMVVPSFNRNNMRIVPMGNPIRTSRQQQFQQEAIRRSQFAQRFRPFFNATPSRFGVATVQQANSILQTRQQPVIQQASTVDLSRFPNFGTNNGNEMGNQLINQLMSFQQISADLPGQSGVQQQLVPRVMPVQLPADQQFLNNMLIQPVAQFPNTQGQFQTGQGVRSTQTVQQLTGNNIVTPTFSNNLPVPQLPFTSAQGINSQGQSTVTVPMASSGINPPQWSFQSGNTPAVIGGQDASQILQTLPQTGSSVENNQMFTGLSNQGITDPSGQVFNNQGAINPTAASPSSQTTGDNTPVQFDEQITMFHPITQEMCYRGRNLSPDLEKWIVNILTMRAQRPGGDVLCRNRDSYTITEIIEMEKELLALGIDPHNPAAFKLQPEIVDMTGNGVRTGTAASSNTAPSTGLPIPPADVLVAFSTPTQGSLQSRS
ncbi:uncharacterized protein LOC110447553 isoform X2 [Mizuhopecten yessoensis]|uniref:Uncharacterized protein n=2 Tax=Mizuhopecten yessoensis TaxID=6573 RepID=A0A210QV78_MIZYE|nr:uncharacterized protein LOC110447553 isoform X2 [Mizuhopecten yessoensis]OWF52582.1 hypothetical protein KP79_PYT04047 [Mizuhopecten yessoensis]